MTLYKSTHLTKQWVVKWLTALSFLYSLYSRIRSHVRIRFKITNDDMLSTWTEFILGLTENEPGAHANRPVKFPRILSWKSRFWDRCKFEEKFDRHMGGYPYFVSDLPIGQLDIHKANQSYFYWSTSACLNKNTIGYNYYFLCSLADQNCFTLLTPRDQCSKNWKE